MDYEKKYKEALGRASKIKLRNPIGRIQDEIDSIFPELAESEDEKIREFLCKIVKQYGESFNTCDGIPYKNVIAWIEKQGEQKPVISDDAIREGIAHFGITQYQIDNWLKKYVDVKNT